MNTEDKIATAYKALFDILNDDNNTQGEDDKTFRKNTTEQITKRDEQYTALLSHFVGVTRIRNILKEICKWFFYFAVIISVIVLAKIIYSIFNAYLSSATIEQIAESMPLLITSMVSFASAIIVIPTTITKYLFSTEEDKNITQIILHTQEHDVSGRKWAMDFKKIIENMDDKGKAEISTTPQNTNNHSQANNKTDKEQEN